MTKAHLETSPSLRHGAVAEANFAATEPTRATESEQRLPRRLRSAASVSLIERESQQYRTTQGRLNPTEIMEFSRLPGYPQDSLPPRSHPGYAEAGRLLVEQWCARQAFEVWALRRQAEQMRARAAELVA